MHYTEYGSSRADSEREGDDGSGSHSGEAANLAKGEDQVRTGGHME
jgi:hypothetical protein